MIDAVDYKILKILQKNARTTNAEIARKVGLAPSAVFERIRKLEAQKVVEGYCARLNPDALAKGLLAFIFVRTSEKVGGSRTATLLARLPEVLEVHNIAGEDCYLVKIRVADTRALESVLRERVGAIPSVRSTRTTIVLKTFKDDAAIPLESPERVGG